MIKKYEMVRGKEVQLSHGRAVFVAERPDVWLIEFTSKEGSATRLQLSDEAMYAFQVLTGARADTELKVSYATRAKRTKSRWQLVPEQEA